MQVNVEVQVAPGVAGWPAAAAEPPHQHQQHKQQQQQQQRHNQQQQQRWPGSQQTLEEQLESSMQLCSSDDEGHVGQQLEDEVLWYQCVHAVKGMRQAEQV